MDAYHLSKRLAKAAAYVPQGARLADIGSDHAYLPANLAINHIIDYGVAGEVVKGPYENAVHEIQREHLEENIFMRDLIMICLKPLSQNVASDIRL